MPQLRQPRLAEMVANSLREQIVSGRLVDAGQLPSLDHLVAEYGVSRPSMREALRVLENEGLITVRRGNVGGAVVHRPKAEGAAYMLGLVLQSQHVAVGDVVNALDEMLALCASLCGRRRDRAKQVVPQLQAAHQASVDAAEADGAIFEPLSRAFHQEITRGSGNRTLLLVVSSLDWLWSSQEQAWTRRVIDRHESPDPQLRRAGLRAHEQILAAIKRGDGDASAELFRQHARYPGKDADVHNPVTATNLGPSRSSLYSPDGSDRMARGTPV